MSEIDTSAPFESVKQPVNRFGRMGFWKPTSHNPFAQVEVFNLWPRGLWEQVHVHLKRHLMNDLPQTDDVVAQWCRDAFVAKDKLLDKHVAEDSFREQLQDTGRPVKSLLAKDYKRPTYEEVMRTFRPYFVGAEPATKCHSTKW
ncbi:unnamed protein product [Fraxinus pennsylvanica]|uniref:Acyltransferase C-terminal domain-containing protein n=1 Tax=Fraxinus pennsylvanica TaxID=56036 RepID=A0AAD2A7B0_9LAMI|nr:unnamed protein product [Fraxinus pennsylvanica]